MCYISVDDFMFLKGNPQENAMRQRFDCRVRCLLGAVNQLPIMQLVQPIRKGRTGINPKKNEAFNLNNEDLVKYEVGHWFVFTSGFRESAQYNIGMYGDYLRVGMGFNIDRTRGHASNDVGYKVANSFNKFRHLVVNNPSYFISSVSRILNHLSSNCPGSSFGIEYILGPQMQVTNFNSIGNLISFIDNIVPDAPNNVFTHPIGNSKWFFIGAILSPGNYTWKCTRNCLQGSSEYFREDGRVSQDKSSQTWSQVEEEVDLLNIIERVFEELFASLGNSL